MAATNFSGPVVSTDGFKTGSTTLTGADFAAVQALVSGGGTGLWVNRPLSPTLNYQYSATDIGPNGATLYWNGTRWKVFYQTLIGENSSIVTGITQLADQYIGGLGPFPVGLIAVGDVLSYHIGFGKNGTTDAYGTTTTLRIGADGTVSDASIGSTNYQSFMGASIRSSGFEKWFKVETATTIRPLGPNNGGASWANITSGIAPETTYAVIDILANAWRIGVSTTMNGTTNAPQITYQRLVLHP